MRRFLLGLAIVAMTATAANATSWVWWQLDTHSDNTPGIEATEQGLGLPLRITKPLVAPLGYYEFHLSMWFQTDGTGGTTSGLAAHRSNMWRGPDTSMVYHSAAPAADILNPLGWTTTAGFTGGSQNSGDGLIMNWGQARQASGPVLGGGPVKFANFVLRIMKPTEVFSEIHEIYQTVGTGMYGWAPATPTTLNQVLFADNAFVYGSIAQNTWALAHATGRKPVIIIHAVPEPATLALFGLGLLGLIRRR